MRYGSVCSGIEAATVAWHPLGWLPVFFAEIDKFPSAVLAHHYPTVPNLGDLTKFQEWPNACACVRHDTDHERCQLQQSEAGRSVSPVGGRRTPASHRTDNGGGFCARCGGAALDVLVGGTPCQSFSVAGLRAGLADPRGNLALTYLAVADKYRPRWVVWENVPGVLSSGGGWDVGAFLAGLAELGYGWAYRVLDAQYFGLAQRRARVFVVGHLGDWRRAAAVLFERESLSGHPAPRREAGQDASGSTGDGLARCVTVGEAKRQDWETCTLLAHALRAEGFDASEDGTGRGTPLVPVAHAFDARQSDVIQYGDQVGPLDTDGHSIGVLAFHENQRAEITLNDTVGAINSGGGKPGQGYPAITAGMAVRRLTPRECERLQGFPDDYTLIPYRGKLAADGPRYKALGNSMAVPVMAWIGQRIAMVDAIPYEAVA